MKKRAPKPDSASELHERDFFAWTKAQARLLREKRFDELDFANLIDEVEGAGEAEKRQIETHLETLLTQLLKWKYQPGARTAAWRSLVDEQRRLLAYILEMSPSLSAYPAEVFQDSYLVARLAASKESGMDAALFPMPAPFTLQEALDEEFWPLEPSFAR